VTGFFLEFRPSDAARGFTRFAQAAAVSPVILLAQGTTSARAERIANAFADFAGLDKITGRIITFSVSIDEMVQFGTLRLKARACYTRPITEAPQTDAFVEVDEVKLSNQVERIFSGWMFAASPGLHAVEHPIYDIWLTGCHDAAPVVREAPQAPANAPKTAPKAAPAKPAPAPAKPAPKPAPAKPAPKPPVE
jgi:hypothetical protein